jgi:hypothetical protein
MYMMFGMLVNAMFYIVTMVLHMDTACMLFESMSLRYLRCSAILCS